MLIYAAKRIHFGRADTYEMRIQLAVLDWVMYFSHNYGVYIQIYNITMEYYYIQLPVFMLHSVTVYNKRHLSVMTSVTIMGYRKCFT